MGYDEQSCGTQSTQIDTNVSNGFKTNIFDEMQMFLKTSRRKSIFKRSRPKNTTLAPVKSNTACVIRTLRPRRRTRRLEESKKQSAIKIYSEKPIISWGDGRARNDDDETEPEN